MPSATPFTAADLTQTPLSRRGFVCAATCSLIGTALASACSGDDAPTGPGATGNPPPTGSMTFVNGVITLTLSAIPDLTASNGHIVIGATDSSNNRADVIVINVGPNSYRTFSSVCTHEGCTVTGYTGVRMTCPCHGSEYDVSGNPVAGPAPRALREYATTFAPTPPTLTVRIV